MQVKNIRIFREFFKTNIRQTNDANRDPHFAGHSREVDGDTVFGFFDMYHGLKPDMENLLKTILEMARDSQALYEFMQNAVDAESTDFLLFHHNDEVAGQHYLAVANNGDPFSLRGILAILNIGASDKYRNPNSIGQFGVGFKLAHRLVGEETGLKALMEENKGPVLFSWEAGELKQLAETVSYLPVDPALEGKDDKAITADKHPWLFKILYTNFPCLPNDQITDVKGRIIENAFSDNEKEALRAVAQKCIALSPHRDFSHGSLLLIPLHPAKITELTEDAAKYGLEISTAILNKRSGKHKPLDRIVLNGAALNTLQTEFESFRYDASLIKTEREGEDMSLFGKIETLEIDFLYGDALKDENIFAGKPQFYLYFPMTEERHGFRFAVHSNGFSFTSARTALQDKIDRNKRIFDLLIVGLIEKLGEYAVSNKPRFERIYTSLLLSQPGENGKWKENREWLKEDFWEPLMKILERFIPVKDAADGWRFADEKEMVVINMSRLPLEQWVTGPKAWFYWNNSNYPGLCNDAFIKLKVQKFGFIDALGTPGVPQKINDWLAVDPARSLQVLAELNEVNRMIDDLTKDKAKNMWDVIAELQIWAFGEHRLSIKELSENADFKHHLIKYGPLNGIAHLLIRAGFALSVENLDYYANLDGNLRSRNAARLPYLYDYGALNSLLSELFTDAKLFSPQEKETIFKGLLKAIRDSGSKSAETAQKMKVLVLFPNERGEVKPLGNLLQRDNLSGTLKNWHIRRADILNLELADFTATTEEQVWENVICKYWSDIAQSASRDAPERRALLFSTAKAFHQIKPAMDTLSDKNIRFSEEELILDEKHFFYHPRLEDFTKEDYIALQSVATKTGLGAIPQQTLLSYYKEKPFALQNNTKITFEIPDDGIQTDRREAAAIIKLCHSVHEDKLKNLLFSQDGNNICLNLIKDDHVQCVTAVAGILQYIKNWCKGKLVPMPGSLHDAATYISLREETLIAWFIQNLDDENVGLEDLIAIIRSHGTDDHRVRLMQLLAKRKSFNIESDLKSDPLMADILSLCIGITNRSHRRELLSGLVSINVDTQLLRLSEISTRGSDQLLVCSNALTREFSVAALLGGEKTNAVNKTLTATAQQWADAGIGSFGEIEEALGIKEKRNPEEVLKELSKKLSEGRLTNDSQLAFVLLMSPSDNKILDGFSVETAGGWQSLSGNTFYCKQEGLQDFLPGVSCLSAAYEKTMLLLGLLDNEAFGSGTTQLLYAPHLEGAELKAPGIESLAGEEQKSFLLYLQNLWAASDRPGKLSAQQEWKNLLGFDPASLVLAEDWATSEEQTAAQLLTDSGDTETKTFLQALGANGLESPLVQWRRYLSGKLGQPIQNLNAGNAFQTLIWLAQRGLDVKPDQLSGLYQNMQKVDITTIPLPVYGGDRDEMKIVMPDSSSFRYLSKEQQEQAVRKGITVKALASCTSLLLVPELSCLSGLWSNIQQQYKPVVISWDQVDWAEMRKIRKEWDYVWYSDWAKKSNAQIFAIPGAVVRQIIVEGIVLTTYLEGDADLDPGSPNETYINKDLGTPAALDRLATLNAYSHQLRDDLRQAFSQYSIRTATLLEKIKSDAALQEVQKLIEAAERRLERQETADRLQEADNQYTMQWFMDLLEMVRKQQNVNNQPAIEFGSIRLLPQFAGIYELSGGSTHIPENIEEYQHITAVLTFRNDQEQLETKHTTVEATRKHQNLWVSFHDVSLIPILQREGLSVMITFTRTTDLIQALKLGFEGLGYAPEHNLKDTLSHHIRFIFGPPGTGKTTEVANRLIRRMNEDVPGPVIVLTPTNKAADVLAHKIIQCNGGVVPEWLVRYGTCTDPALLVADVVQSENTVINAGSHTVLITTVHRFPYSRVVWSLGVTDKQTLCHCPWSLVVFDEASMIPLPYVTFAIHKCSQSNPGTEFMIAGDPLQISPVFDLDVQDVDNFDNADELQKENIYTMVGLSSFDAREQLLIPIYGENGCIDNLPIQHRSVPVIGELFSRFQYQGILQHSRGTAANSKSGISRSLPGFFEAIGFKPITLIRYKVTPGDTIYNPKRLNGSPLHIHTALLVTEFLKRFQQEVEKEQMKRWSVGVISPYRAQASLMGRMIEGTLPFSQNMSVAVDTVHGFQGDENQLVVTVLNPGKANAAYSRFLKESHILNVAISRSEDYLILFVPDEETHGLSSLSLLFRGCTQGAYSIFLTASIRINAVKLTHRFLRKLLWAMLIISKNIPVLRPICRSMFMERPRLHICSDWETKLSMYTGSTKDIMQLPMLYI